MNAAGSEYQFARTYVEWIADLPWAKKTADRLDVAQALSEPDKLPRVHLNITQVL